MAYERLSDANKSSDQVLLADGLDSFVDNSLKLYNQQVTIRNQEEEANFNKQVLEQNLPLDAQLAYRKEQLTRVSDDPTERARIRGEISNLKQRVEQKKYSDDYTQKLQDHAAGITSIDSLISWLQDQLSSTTNEAIKSNINEQLVQKEQERFTAVQNMLTDQTNYALRDKSGSLIEGQIGKVNEAKAKALLSGDGATAANLDLQLQALQQAKVTNSIETDQKHLAVATVSGASNAVGLLDSYNNKIASSDTNTPITVNGVNYANAREFWSYTRDAYLADQGQSGFFSRINDETKNSLLVKASQNILSTNDISASTSIYNNLYARPELAGYTAKIDVAKQDTLQSAANALGDKIVGNYDKTLDLNEAVASLNALKATGVNVDASMAKILTSATALKTNNISQIVQAAQDLMSTNPGLSVTDAVTQAVQKGAGVVLSPVQLLDSSPKDIATSVLDSSQKGTNTQDTTNTINPQNKAALPNPNPLPGTPPPASAPGAVNPGGSYTFQHGDTLSAVAAKHNTTVAALAAANNIVDPNKIQAGATIKIPSIQAPNAPAAPTYTAPAAPTSTTPTQQPISQPIAPVAPANPTPTPTSPSAGGGTYTIKNGDTLSAIALAHGTTVTNLTKLNNITDPNKIQAGATIKLQ